MYPIKITSKPEISAVTLQEMKDFLREDRDVEDHLIQSLIETAEYKIIQHTGFHLLNTQMEMYFQHFEDFKIPHKPFNEDEPFKIEYENENGEWIELSAEKYELIDQENPTKVEFKSGLPKLSDSKYPIKAVFTIGFGALPEDVPSDFKTSIKLLTMMFHKRELPNSESENIRIADIHILSTILKNRTINTFK